MDPAIYRGNSSHSVANKSEVKMVETPNRTPLGLAAERGELKTVSEFIRHGCNADERDGFQETPLFLAAGAGKGPVVKYLLDQQHVDVNAMNWDGWTPLIWACARGHLDCARILVDFFADVNAATSIGWRAIHFAAMNGRRDMVDFLLFNGASVRVRNKHGCSPAYAAATEDIRKLLERLEEQEHRKHVLVQRQLSASVNHVMPFAAATMNKEERTLIEDHLNETTLKAIQTSYDYPSAAAPSCVTSNPWPYSRTLLKYATGLDTPDADDPDGVSSAQIGLPKEKEHKAIVSDIYRYQPDTDDFHVFRIDYPTDPDFEDPVVFRVANPKSILSARDGVTGGRA